MMGGGKKKKKRNLLFEISSKVSLSCCIVPHSQLMVSVMPGMMTLSSAFTRRLVSLIASSSVRKEVCTQGKTWGRPIAIILL